MLDDTKIKLRELFGKMLQKQTKYDPLIIEEENGETIFDKEGLFDAIITIYGLCRCYEGCYCGTKLEEVADVDWTILNLVQDILELAFEFTKE